jgi:hypothetical protein
MGGCMRTAHGEGVGVQKVSAKHLFIDILQSDKGVHV